MPSGLRGISTRGLVLSTALCMAYLGLRFLYLDVGVPSLAERSSGYFLERLEPDELVQRFGNVGIWKGYQVRPRTRAASLYAKVRDYIYEEGGDDWALVATRLEEVVALLPQKVDAAIELGNAWLRLGDGASAISAYRRLLEQDKAPVDALVRAQLERQVERIAAGGDLTRLEPLRNPWLE